MANYNKDYMAAYKQYGQTMTAGGGGSNMSGTGSSTMQVFNAINFPDDKPSKGLAAKPTTTTKEDKPSFWDRITSLFEQNEVDVTNVYKPSVDPAKIYNQPLYTKVPEASDYVYRADMSERTQDMVEQAMGYEKPQLGQLQLLDTGAMTQEEKDRLGPLIKLADEIRNGSITTTELPPVGGEEQSSLMDALMEGQPTAGLMSRPSSFTGGSVQVASNIPNWMQDMSAAELTDALVGIKEGTVDPETGQKIQSAEDVEASTAMPDVAPEIDTMPPEDTTLRGDVVDTALTTLSDNTSLAKSDIVDQVKDLVGPNIFTAAILGSFEKESGTNFDVREENLNYSMANAKAVPFSQTKIDKAMKRLSESDRAKVEAGRNVEAFGKALMDESYSGGSDYKGRGLIHITHDYNYEAVGDRIGVDLVNNPELVNDPRYAVPAALAYLDLQGFFDQTPTKNSLHRMVNRFASNAIKNQRWSATNTYLDQIREEGGSSDSSPRPMLRPE